MIQVGLAGWSYADWEGRVYPKPKPPGFHPLPYLARYVDVMEINSSFYALPNPQYAKRWAELVAPFPDFRFTAKLHQSFTHGALDDLTAPAAEAYRLGVEPLQDAGRLLALLVQFPASFRQTQPAWRRLERIRLLFPAHTLVLELRHRSWFDDATYTRLESHDFRLAHIDLPAAAEHPPQEHPSLGSLSYLRLHGRNRGAWFDPNAGRDDRYDYRYDEGEVDAVVDRLKTLAARSEKTLLVANNHFGGQAVANAIEIKGTLIGGAPPAPLALVEAYPDLRAKTTPEAPAGQMPLF